MSGTDPRSITLSPGLVSTSEDEVERMLSVLMARREPLAALLADGDASRWKLRFVDPMRQHIIVELISGTSENLLRNQHVTFFAEFGGTNIEFTASSPEAVAHEGGRAIRLAFPKVTVSRQRRAHPRAPVPSEAPLHCAIPAGAGVALEAQIIDISEGGLGLLVRSSYLVPAPARSSAAGASSVPDRTRSAWICGCGIPGRWSSPTAARRTAGAASSSTLPRRRRS